MALARTYGCARVGDQTRAARCQRGRRRKIWALTPQWRAQRWASNRLAYPAWWRADPGLWVSKQSRELAKEPNSAFVGNPTGPNQVGPLDFSEFQTTPGRDLAHCRMPPLVSPRCEHPFARRSSPVEWC